MTKITLFFFSVLLTFSGLFGDTLSLKKNFERAEPGDYLVIAQGRIYNLFYVFSKEGDVLKVQEITIPGDAACREVTSWKKWVEKGAPFNTAWVQYEINLETGEMDRYYSFTKQGWYVVPKEENFLRTLLKLEFTSIPENERRKAGKGLWQPAMVVEGRVIPDVVFEAYTARWPTDGSLLSGKTIEVYLPKNTEGYLNYFPYWLQVKGMIGPAKVRIVDSGKIKVINKTSS